MTEIVPIRDVMRASGVGFGTSGARGLVSAMTDRVCCAYAMAFLQALERRGEIQRGSPVGLAGDLRSSTERIMAAVSLGIAQAGYVTLNAGPAPSPAIALLGLGRAIPTMMVTGSHIPDDRNGIKFNKTTGEILKTDEEAILAETVQLPDVFDGAGQFRVGPSSSTLPQVDPTAKGDYVDRWLRAFPRDLLRGRRIVVFGHSAVGRELLVEIMGGLGADVQRVGWSDRFIPVDTEAIRREDVESAEAWAKEFKPFSIVSTDGDSDRPLVSDENGRWLRGDVLGVLTARFLGADTVITPVSANTVVERCGAFARVARTRIGSPYVIAEMQRALADGRRGVVGYEANGGFLTATPFAIPGGGLLSPLPTRDPVIAMLCVLGAAIRAGTTISAVEALLPRRITASARIQNFPNNVSGPRLAELAQGGIAAYNQLLGGIAGNIERVDVTDGVRGTTVRDEIIHLRASGNAPEMRCYAEASTHERAAELAERALDTVRKAWL